MSTFAGLYDVRDATPDDINFILATFLRGLYYGDSWFSEIDKKSFMNNYPAVIKALIAKSTVKVACLKDDTNVILGYSILSHDFQTVHWVFVKNAWRRRGVGRSLTPKYPSAVTHLTSLGKSLMTKIPGAVFDPFKV